MKYSELKIGLRIRAIINWADCWTIGDEFTIAFDNNNNYYIMCSEGMHILDDDLMTDDLPEFEIIKDSSG